MATPMKKEKDSSKPKQFPEYLDPSSPKFDSKLALYAQKLEIPVSNAKQFNNISEFENFLKGKDAKSCEKEKEKSKVVLPGIIAERAAAQAREAVRRAALIAKKMAGPSKQSATQERRNRSTTVFTRMENYDKGPMSILLRCVKERLRVIVVIRAAVAVRSHCRGYVVAFDKHMNIALMDVDEKFIRPVKKATEDRQDESLSRVTERLSVDPHIEQKSKNRNDPKKPQDSNKKTTSKNIPNLSKTDLRSKLKKLSASKDESRNCMSDTGGSRKTKLKIENSDRKTKSDLDDHSESQCSDMETSSNTRPKVHKKLRKKQFQPFWPLYKKWAERRCYTSYEIVDRHINQLFIRGDNIVSVAIAR